MFTEATNRHTALADKIHADLETNLGELDRTARSWFDESSQSVADRQTLLYATSGLASRAAQFVDEDNAAGLNDLAHDLSRQASILDELIQVTASQEYDNAYGNISPLFSSRGLTEEQYTTASYNTDWDMFVNVEPKFFVEANRDADASELRDRAFSYIVEETYSHGLSRKAKVKIAEQFLSRVEAERRAVPKVAKKASKSVEISDVDLYL